MAAARLNAYNPGHVVHLGSCRVNLPALAASTRQRMRIRTIPQVYRNVNRWREILAILSKYGLAGWLSRFDFAFGKGLFKNRNGQILAEKSRETRIRL